MTETVKKGKRKKLFQVAKELNLSTDTIREFLEKKGVTRVTPNTRIDEETYDQLLQRFSFEKKEADKIQRRRDERDRELAEQLSDDEEILETATATADPAGDAEEDIAPTEPVAEAIGEAEGGISDDIATIEASEEPAAAHQEEIPAASASEEQPETSEDDTNLLIEEQSNLVAAKLAEAAVEDAAVADQEEESATPQVGDIIDHPVAREYLERQQREEERKRTRQKQVVEKLKSGESATKTANRGDATADDLGEDDGKKKEKRKNRKERQEERDQRRRKALEMVKREGKKLRPEMYQGEEAAANDDAVKSRDGSKRRRKKKKEVDQQAVDSTLKKTLAEMRDTSGGKRRRKRIKDAETEEEIEVNVVKVSEFITTQDLANLLDVGAPDVIRKCLELGLLVTINQRLEMDTIRLLAEEFGFEVEEEEEFGSDFLEEDEEEDDPASLLPRPPVVTIMGHVDHGKTSLLDYIRNSNVVAGESGGITQHIGAYEVELADKRKISFLDTPGHEAFTAMRARGAQVTDIVVLVVAADDRVMPQTEEALDHAKAAGVSIVIAINKIDKPNADPEAIKKQLAAKNILVEDWGGQYQSVEVSAKTGEHVQDLLEKILLEAELLDLKANPAKRARGMVLEAQLDKGKGPVATLLVQNGTLRVGDSFVIGQHYGRVRAMLDERGNRVDEADPSTSVQILGINGIPEAGDRFIVMEDERSVRDIAQSRQQLKREQDFRQVKLLTLDELSRQIQAGDVKELKLIVKADVDGSAQALTDSLLKLSTDTVEVQVIRRAVGPIVESDVILAAASQAIIIGFHVRPSVKAKEIAEVQKVDIRLYRVIYDAIEDVELALEGMLEPIAREIELGSAEIREVFKISRIGSVAGCYVLNGKLTRNAKIRLIRNDVELHDGKLSSLKRFKDDVKEVATGYECGLSIDGFNDIKQGDIVEAYEIVMEEQKLKRVSEK